ncbi:MAG: hypothetical protein ACOYXT_23545 [Bacteroidota bacterium]
MVPQFECIWKRDAFRDREQAKELWKRLKVFPNEATALQRVNEIVFVAKSDNEVIGMSTVRCEKVKTLNDNYFYETRCFVSPDHRAPALDTQLIVQTKKYFENNPEASDVPCVGLIMIVENDFIKKNWTKAVWAGTDMVFMGYTKQGHHIRVSYFKGARI